MFGNRAGPSRDLREVLEAVRSGFAVTVERLARLERKVGKMATRDDLDAAIGNIEASIQDLGDDLKAAIEALKTKAGPDLAAEVGRLEALQAKIGEFDAAAEAEVPPSP